MQATGKRIRSKIAALCLFGASTAAVAYSMGKQEVLVCPIDGKRFHAWRGTAVSAYNYKDYALYAYSRQLDLKPTGAVPAPGGIPRCPSNGFLIYKANFSESEIARLRRYVKSSEYASLKDRHTDHYLAAKMRAHLGEKPAQLRFVLLQATWEAQSNWQYSKYAAEALEAYRSALTNPYRDANEWIIDQLVAGELERRLGQFDSASARFLLLTGRKEIGEEVFANVLKVQLQLVRSKDNRNCTPREPDPGEQARSASPSPQYACRPRDDLPEVLPGQPCEAPASKSPEAAILYEQEMKRENHGKEADGTNLYRKALAMENECNARDATQFYGLAANAGHGRAAKRLGDIYASGVPGVVPDPVFSLRWYDRARQLGEKIPSPVTQ